MLYLETLSARAAFLQNKDFYISIDDTSKGQKQKPLASIVIGVLGPKMEQIPMHIEIIPAKTGLHLYRCIKHTLESIFTDYCQARVRVLVTDSAKTMRTCGLLLKKDFPSLIHVFCVVHKIHLAVKVLQKLNKLANKFIGQLKQILSRSAARNRFLKKFTYAINQSATGSGGPRRAK